MPKMSAIFNPVRLIEEVKLRPGLYSTERWDRAERLQLWKEVGAAIFPDWAQYNKSTVYGRVLQIQKKWKSLRDAYNRELRLRKSSDKRSRIVYRYFKKMTFLGGFEGTVSSDEASTGQDLVYTQDIEDMETSFKLESPDDIPILKKIKKIKRKRRRKRRESSDVEVEVPIDEPEEMEMPVPFQMEFSGEAENDSDRLFLLSFVPEMRQLPPHIKMWTRAQIANIMQEAVHSQYNKSKPGTSREHVNVKTYKSDSPDS